MFTEDCEAKIKPILTSEESDEEDGVKVFREDNCRELGRTSRKLKTCFTGSIREVFLNIWSDCKDR